MRASEIIKTLRPALEINLCTVRQLAMILQIYEHKEPQHVRDISRCHGFSKPAVSRVLDALSEEHHMIRRLRDEEDGRNILIEITKDGRDFCRATEGAC
jgi:DNA-binding MarR family transcriptional regulator